MIKLDVDAYCQNCPSFEVVTKTKTELGCLDTTITCSKREVCHKIKRYLRKHGEQEITRKLKELAKRHLLSLYVCQNWDYVNEIIRVIFYDPRRERFITRFEFDPSEMTDQNWFEKVEQHLEQEITKKGGYR